MSLVRPIVAPNTLYNALVPSLQQLAAVFLDLRLCYKVSGLQRSRLNCSDFSSKLALCAADLPVLTATAFGYGVQDLPNTLYNADVPSLQ